VALVTLAVPVAHSRAQDPPPFSHLNLPISLFERYLDSLREQAAIPGMSAVLVQNGRIVWERGFGYQELEGFVAATPDTLFPLLDLSQTVSSTVLLQQCMEYRALDLRDRVTRWNSQFPEDATTVAQLLAHATPPATFRYDPDRYAGLTMVIQQCASAYYPRLLTDSVINHLGMSSTVPSHDLSDDSLARRYFSNDERARYAALLRRLAVPYRLDSRGRATPSDYTPPSLNAATGMVSTVRDLARFDGALDASDLLESDTRQHAWQAAGPLPTGLGWFVQQHHGERIVWHFGMARDAYSALYIKVPGRNVTLILLANSDALAAPYTLSNGDLTVSLFAQLFLKLFVS
jgi:CubicO group peptidase (beta-lactamase class C family)